ncbi:unnamed protein product [Paramecium sonneborni]|uniref:Uncharacterized protein n=1 Tax=Paramecium sonneborni TaxID=65129 RepID=A0A8S1K377_9CILI|nr:unnamed protein product [Paramecium sonneborni]
MKQQFLKLNLEPSQQEPSCVTLENWIDQLQNPDFRINLNQCQEENEMINLFPIVGYGIQVRIHKIDNQNAFKIKILAISKVEKIIDLSTLNQPSRDKPNFILPLLKKKEQNHDLLKCELFQRKISYLLTKNNQIFIENSYLLVMQSTLKYLITIYEQSGWQDEIMEEIFEVCQQVFLESKLYNSQIKSSDFKASQFKLLNVFCLFKKQKINEEEIYQYFIKPKLESKAFYQYDLNDQEQNGLGAFFDCLEIRDDQISFENIQSDIEHYLDENNYFYLRIFYGKHLSKLIKYFLTKQTIKDKLKKELFFKVKEGSEEIKQLISLGKINEQEVNKLNESKTLIVNFVQSTIHKNLLNRLIKYSYNQENIQKFFESLNEAIQKDNYYAFLQRNVKYDDLVQSYHLNNLLNPKNGSYADGLYQLAIYIEGKILKQISILQLKKKDYEDFEIFKQNQVIQEKRQMIQVYLKIFGVTGQNAESMEKNVLERVSEICWINYSASKINFQKEEEIINFYQLVKCFPEKNFDLDIYQKYLNDQVRFCYKIKQQTSNFKYFEKFEKQQLMNLLPRDTTKANYFMKIFLVWKNQKEQQSQK